MADRLLMLQGITIIPSVLKEPDEIDAARFSGRWTTSANLLTSSMA